MAASALAGRVGGAADSLLDGLADSTNPIHAVSNGNSVRGGDLLLSGRTDKSTVAGFEVDVVRTPL